MNGDMAHTQPLPVADINTPEELLANAEHHYASSDPNSTRAAVLEAMAAFETFVQKKVFTALGGKLDGAFVQWLDEKTRMDFDSRLSVLAPVALDRPINKQGPLWQAYREARNIRHRVVHAGARVPRAKARFVIDTVYDWLALLGSSIEVQNALLGLKRFFERRSGPKIESGRDAVDLITKYFSKSKDAEIVAVDGIEPGLRPDVVLKIGKYTVIVEAKYVSRPGIEPAVNSARQQLAYMMDHFEATVGAVVIFNRGPVAYPYDSILAFDDGRIYLLVVSV